jgi:hypothetical protein
MTDAQIKYDAVLICDDVRREDNGKLILIGVYHEGIVVPGYPATVLMRVVCNGEVIEAGSYKVSYRIEDSDGGVLFRTDQIGSPEMNLSPGRFLFAWEAMIVLTKNTVIRVVDASDPGELKELISRRVAVGQDAPAN